MPVYKCEECGCVDNTALTNYWSRNGSKALCSDCDPMIGGWHNVFPKKLADNYMMGSDGFLYSKEQVESGDLRWREEYQGFKILGPASDDYTG